MSSERKTEQVVKAWVPMLRNSGFIDYGEPLFENDH